MTLGANAVEVGVEVGKKPAAKSADKIKKRRASAKSFVIKRPSVRVHGYYAPTRKRGRCYDGWEVRYRFKGVRVRKKIAKRSAAMEYAESIANRLENGNTALFNLTNERLADLLHKEERLQEIEAQLAKRGVTLEAVLEVYDRQQARGLERVGVSELVERMCAAKEGDGCSVRHVEDLRTRGNRFAKDFVCAFCDLRGPTVDGWLRKFPGRRTRNNYRATILQLVDFAKGQKVLARDWCELEGLGRARVKGALNREIWTPAQFRVLMDSAEELHRQGKVKDLVAYLVIGGFAGPRSCELLRMDWVANVRFDEAEIFLDEHLDKEHQSKTYRTRVVRMQANLAAWLAGYANGHGPVCPYRTDDGLHAALRKVAAHAGLGWLDNGLRKSYISYRVAMGVDIKTVADETGNSPAKIHEFYLRRPSTTLATEWFNLFPSTGQKILNLPFATPSEL